MPRYFFHLHECGIATLDYDGLDRDSLINVRSEALRAAREVMCAEVAEGNLCLSCYIEVHDAAGEIVMTVPFTEAVDVSGI
jgi:hypothetical protein